MKTLLKSTILLLLYLPAFSQNNTGIGTTTPNSNALLELDNNSNPLGLLLPRQDISTFVGLGASENGLMVFNTVDNKVYTWNGSAWVSSTSEWGVNGNDIFSLNSGNVGIGTNLPGEKLTVVDNVFGGIVSLNSSSFNTLMDFNNTSTNPANWTFGYLGNTGVNPGFMTFLRGSHRLVVTNNGDVGIADTNPQARLEINSSGNSSASHALLINNSNPTNIFAVQDDGNVGIGTINPDETLTVGSPLGIGYVFPAISVGGATSGGGLVIGSTTNYLNMDHSNTFNRGRIISTDAGGVGQGDIEFRVGGIGINTPTPQNDLDIEGGVAIGAAYSGSNIAPTNGAIVEGQVGIGTNSVLSSNKLQVNTGATNPYSLGLYNNYTGGLPQYGLYNEVVQSTGSAFGFYGFLNSSGTNPFYGMRLFYLGTGTGTRYGLTVSNEDVNYFSGNLGIGSTATPTSTLQVNGTGQISGRLELTATTDASGTVGSGVLEIASALRIDGNEIITNANTTLFLQNDNNGDLSIGNGRVYVDASLNRVGVGTSAPATQFHLNHTSGFTNGLSISNSLDADRWHFYCYTTNTLRLHFNDVERGTFNSTTGAYSSVSDRRFKNDIKNMPSVLDKVSQLQPVEYKFNWQENPNESYIGFIAQDVEPLFPSLVFQTKSDDPSENTAEINDSYSLDYSGFSVIAIKAIQELKAENDDLKARIEALENK